MDIARTRRRRSNPRHSGIPSHPRSSPRKPSSRESRNPGAKRGPDPENARCIVEAFDQFGFKSVDLSVDDFQTPDQVVQLGVPPVRVDILTSITGVSWAKAASGSVEGRYGEIPVYCIGRSSLRTNELRDGKGTSLT